MMIAAVILAVLGLSLGSFALIRVAQNKDRHK